MQTGEIHYFINPFYEHVDYEGMSSLNHRFIGNYFVLNYIINNLQIIFIYDLDTLEFLFVGRTRLGLIITDRGDIREFDVNLRN